jgi:hypothetical protein
MIISYRCDPHFGLMNTNNHRTSWKHFYFFGATLNNEFYYFQKFNMVYNIIQCIQWTFPNIDVSNIYPLKFWHQLDYLMHSLFQKCNETLNIISWKNSKGHLYDIYVLLKIIFINLTWHHFVYWHTISTTMIMM